MSDPSHLLHEATSDLTPDVERLVAGGLSRGRSRRRRQRAGAALATVAVFGVIGAVAGVSLIGGSDDGRRLDVAQAPTSTPTPSGAPGRATLGVTSSTAPDVFEQLAGGTVHKLPLPGNDDPETSPIVDFVWNGYATRIGFTPDDYIDGTSEPDPMKRCVANEEEFACGRGANGLVVATAEFTGPAADGATVRVANVYRPDGWDVLASVSNAATKEGKPISAEPPLAVAQLVDIASSDAWFR